MWPRTKHINVQLHHFREHLHLGLIKVFLISTDQQLADIFMKPLVQNAFLNLRKALLHYQKVHTSLRFHLNEGVWQYTYLICS
jgi:hypothetical protein